LLSFVFWPSIFYNIHRTGGEENFFHCNKCGKFFIEHCFSKETNSFHCVNSVFKLSAFLTKSLSWSLIVCRMLLFNTDEGFTPLYWKSNASKLPGLLWGNFSRARARIYLGRFLFQIVCTNQVNLLFSSVQFLFETTKDITVLPCGHTIHLGCVREMQQHFQLVLYTTKESSMVVHVLRIVFSVLI